MSDRRCTAPGCLGGPTILSRYNEGVARCESLHRPDAWNPTALGGSHASGSWQVLYPSTWRSTDVGRAIDAPFNPYVNAFAAARVWQRQGDSFAEWKDVCIR